MMGDRARAIEQWDLASKAKPASYPFRYPFPPSDVVEFFRTNYGPSYKAFAALDAEKQSALKADLEQLWTDHNTGADGMTSIGAEYLEVVAIRQ